MICNGHKTALQSSQYREQIAEGTKKYIVENELGMV